MDLCFSSMSNHGDMDSTAPGSGAFLRCQRQGQVHRVVPADRAAYAGGSRRRVVPLAEQPSVRGLDVVDLRRETCPPATAGS